MPAQPTDVTTEDRSDRESNPRWSWLSICVLAAPLISVGASLVGYRLLPSDMRIHWSFGGPYYGPEFAPSWMVLVVFPILAGIVAIGSYGVASRIRSAEGFDAVRPIVTLTAAATLAVLLVTQAFLILVNL